MAIARVSRRRHASEWTPFSPRKVLFAARNSPPSQPLVKPYLSRTRSVILNRRDLPGSGASCASGRGSPAPDSRTCAGSHARPTAAARSSRASCLVFLRPASPPSSSALGARISPSPLDGVGFRGVARMLSTASASHRSSGGTRNTVLHLAASPLGLMTTCSPVRGIWPTRTHLIDRGISLFF